MTQVIAQQFGSNYSYRHHVDDQPTAHYSTHTHVWCEMVFVRLGNVTYKIQDKQYTCSQGDLIITRPLEYHVLDTNPSTCYDRQIILFDQSLLENGSLLPREMDICHTQSLPQIQTILNQLDYYCQNFDEETFGKMLVSSLQQIVYLLSLYKVETNPQKYNETLTKAVGYIDDNLFDIVSVAQIANNCFVTENYLYKIFVNHLKTTPHQYLTLRRLACAQQLINQGEKPSKACLTVGFNDYSTFYRSYTKYFKHKPSQDFTSSNLPYNLLK